MISDREMALDTLDMAKHACIDYTKAAMECSNTTLKDMLIQFRNQCEQSQTQIYQIASKNNWYLPATSADPSDINRVAGFYRSMLAQPAMR